MDKQFYKSRQFWLYISTILISTGSVFTGELTLEKVIPALIVDILGVVGIVFRWNNGEPLAGLKLK